MQYIDWLRRVFANKMANVRTKTTKKHANWIGKEATIYVIFAEGILDGKDGSFYIGVTTRDLDIRLKEHLKEAQEYLNGRKRRTKKLVYFSNFIINKAELKISKLNVVPDSGNYKYIIETEWIAYLKSRNIRVLNAVNSKYF